MANYFTFNGKSCKEYGLKCKEISHLSFASKCYESIKIPGRTGNLLIDDGSYENKIIAVIAYLDLRSVVAGQRQAVVNNIKKWLINHVGYKTLTFDDGFSYQAIVNGAVEFEEMFNNYYQITINFECVEVI